MMSLLWILILFIAVMVAWYLGFHMREEDLAQKTQIPRDYLVGLNFLLNEEPDKAVDIFIKMLELDSETVETHLAVGKLFRKRGEVERAIRIHQNLIARPQLAKHYHEQALFELGQDYFSAGVLDRAERIFFDLIETKEYAVPALNALLDIYQQEKAWENAIQAAKRLASATRKNMNPIIAQYYCEQAEVARSKNQNEQVKQCLQEALRIDENCARASLLLAKSDMQAGDFKSALKNLKNIRSQNPDYLVESLDAVASCYEALQEEDRLIDYLTELSNEHPNIPVVLILSERIRRLKGDKVATAFVADYVRRYPSLTGLNLFINLYLSNAEGRARDDLLILQNLMKKILANKSDYQCFSCGFSGKTLHWLCPGCKQWDTTKPAYSFE